MRRSHIELAHKSRQVAAKVGAWRDLVNGAMCRVWPELAHCTQCLYETSGGEAMANALGRHTTS